MQIQGRLPQAVQASSEVPGRAACLQDAANRQAILLIFQTMVAACKDGAIRHVFSGVNPQGCQVFSYQHPSDTEVQHDFLWRTTPDLPEWGRIGCITKRC